MSLKGFNVLIECEDAVGECFVTYGVVARDEGEARQLAEGQAQADGYWNVAIDEAWRPENDDPSEHGDIPEVLGSTPPTYLDEDAYGDEADDDEDGAEDEDEDGNGG